MTTEAALAAHLLDFAYGFCAGWMLASFIFVLTLFRRRSPLIADD